MYMRVINSLTATPMIDGSTSEAPELFDYLEFDSVRYQVVEKVSKYQEVIHGPFDEKVLTHLMTVYVEEVREKED